MPDDRLERTRNPTMVVPPCVRLGHEWRIDWSTLEKVCIRCALRELDGPLWRRPQAMLTHGERVLTNKQSAAYEAGGDAAERLR